MSILNFATGVYALVKGNGNYKSTVSYLPPYAKEGTLIYGHEESVLGTHSLAFPSTNDVWFSFYFTCDSFLSSTPNLVLAQLSSDTDVLFKMEVDDSSAETFVAYVHDGTSFQTVFTNQMISVGQTSRIDVQVDATNNACRAYLGGVLLGEYTGSLASAPLADSLDVGGIGGNSGAYTRLFNIFVADEDTRTITMNQHTITGEGTHATDFSGVYTNISGLGVELNDLHVSSDIVGQEQTYTKDALDAALTSQQILAVGVVSRSAVSDGASINGISFIAKDGTNTAESTTQTLGLVPAPYSYLFTTAPDGTAWDTTKLANTEFGMKSKA